MKRKVISLLMATVLTVFSVTGCGKDSASQSAESDQAATVQGEGTGETAAGEIDFNEEPYTIAFPIITLGEAPADMQLVQDTLNEYLLEKINAKVEMEAISIANLTNTYTLKASGGEKMDIVSMLPASSQLIPMVTSNMLMGIDDLLDQYGKDIISVSGQILDAGKINGTQYFIPCFEDAYTAKGGLTFNSELVKKYDLADEIQEIQTLTDVEPLLALIKENEPGVIPFTGELAGRYQSFLFGSDGLGGDFGVIDFSQGDDLNVVNWFATDAFMDNCKLMRDWFEKGYISKDAATTQDGGNVLVPSGAAFCCISSYAPNQDEGFDLERPQVEWPLADVEAVLTTSAYQATGFSIAASCERPDKVMQFLNLLYSDEYVGTLLMRGIEGKHYNVDENGLLTDLNMDSGYYITFGQFGYQKLEGIPDTYGIDYEEKLEAFCKENRYSPAFGFVFDSTGVQTQIAACSAVLDEYYTVLNCGSVDPETEIPKFLEKLEAAGVNEIIAEKQRQLDEWAKNK